jgi:sigma-B regulation protein RsbU (phosphoserine phosphatase)
MSSRDDEETLRGRVDQLGARLQRLRAFGGLRRILRVAEEDEAIALAAQRVALEVLSCTHFAVYCAEKDDTDFRLLSAAPEGVDLPAIVERGDEFARTLEQQSSLREGELLARLGPDAKNPIALAFRGLPGQLIGFAIVAGSPLDGELLDEVLDELVFDVESALAARMITRLRAEELAVLEIQERELVGLLRDVEARDAIIQRDLEEARQFQRKMLGTPPRVPGVAIEVVYMPLGLVGGDLYAVSADRGTLRLFLADATGHGVRASLTTMFIKSGYEAVRSTAPDPGALLAALNDTIAQTYRSSEMLFSAVCVDLDLASGRIRFASAAHPPICLVRSADTCLVEGGGAFLGLRTGMKFEVQEAHLAPGDGIYLFTDGFSEARKNNVQFGDERLRLAIHEAHGRGARAGQAVTEAVAAFLDGAPMDDDGTFVGVRFGVEDDELDVESAREPAPASLR